MICMYLPSHGQDELECRFIVDNMKDKSEKVDKYNNDDERLSRDLKKHNWLINKLKEQLDVSDTLVSEKSQTATEEKEVKKPQRVRRRRHSISIPSTKFKGVRNPEAESNQESQKETNVNPSCEIIDYSLKRTTKHQLHNNNLDHQKSSDSFVSDDVIYDLRKNKDYCEINDQISNSYSQRENVSLISNDVVYDLSKNKETQSERKIQSYNPMHSDRENSANPLLYWSETNENKSDNYSPNVSHGNISDLRKIRRIDKYNTSDHLKKMTYPFSEDDSSKQETINLINNTIISETQHDQQIIKHNLPFAAPPRREKNMRIQSLTLKDKQKVDISVQTEEVFTVSKEDWNLLNFIKSKGIAEDKICDLPEIESSEIINNSENPSFYNLSDTDSDNENGVINIHILRKLLEQSEKNKNILNKTYNLCNEAQSNADIPEPQITDKKNEKRKNITKVIDILMSKYNQRTINNKRQATTESNIWHAKGRKLYNPTVTHNDNDFVIGQNKRIESDIVTIPKRSAFAPQKPEPTHPQLYHYPLSWSRQSVSPYEAQSNLQLPYKYQQHNYAEIGAFNRQVNAVYGHKMTEYPQIPQRLQHPTPRRLSPYANQQVNYFDVTRTEPSIHYGPVQQNNQYINIRGTESPQHPQAVHPMWSGENRLHMNPQKPSYSRNTRQYESLFRESRLRESDSQKKAWESDITSYPNADWRESK